MKNTCKYLSIVFAAAGMLLSACESDPYSIRGLDTSRSEFQIACEATGGTLSEGACKCDNSICDEGLVCNIKTGKCPAYVPTGSCVGDEKTCRSGQMAQCDGSTWGETTSCPSGACLSDNSDCAECAQNKCEEGMITVCENGKFLKPTGCNSGVCNEAGTDCGYICEAGETQCMNNYMEICSQNHQWERGDRCNAGCDTEGKACASQCLPGIAQCYDEDDGTGILYQCDDNSQLVQDKACKDENSSKKPASCRADHTACGVCLNGPIECKNEPSTSVGIYTACVDGARIANVRCSENVSCHGDSCGECKDGSVSCANDPETHVGRRMTCSDGISTISDCESDGVAVSCRANDSERRCGACLDGDQMCKKDLNLDSIVYNCTGGTWAKVENCANGCADDGKTCRE